MEILDYIMVLNIMQGSHNANTRISFANNSIQILSPFSSSFAFLCKKYIGMPWSIWRLGKNNFEEHTPSWSF